MVGHCGGESGGRSGGRRKDEDEEAEGVRSGCCLLNRKKRYLLFLINRIILDLVKLTRIRLLKPNNLMHTRIEI